MHELEKTDKMEDLLSLARGPTQYVTSFSGYIVNGYRFHTEERDKSFVTQNSGVVVIGNTGQRDENMDYYGILTDVLELQYLGGKRVVLFRCKWFDVYDTIRGVKMDEYGVVSINCKRRLKTNEHFILASQANQAFYANDNVNKGWHVVLKSQPHSSYDIPSLDDAHGGSYQSEAHEASEQRSSKRQKGDI